MKHEKKLKRATALLLALALAWSGSIPDSGLSLVRATEATDAAVDDADSTDETTADATVDEESESTDEATEDQKEPADEETEENNVNEDVEDSEEQSEDELLSEELLDEEILKDEEEEEKEKTELKLIADFDFEGLSAGETMTGAAAKASGSYSLTTSYDGSQALSLNGSNQYLKVTTKDGDSLLGGYDSVSISADVQFLRTDANWLFYADQIQMHRAILTSTISVHSLKREVISKQSSTITMVQDRAVLPHLFHLTPGIISRQFIQRM
jgi:hypothetical protein